MIPIQNIIHKLRIKYQTCHIAVILFVVKNVVEYPNRHLPAQS